jgi:Cytochrome bd terminal oxidase subunit II
MFDTTRMITNMVATGAKKRFSQIKIISTHGGGTIPYLVNRIQSLEHTFGVGAGRLELSSEEVREGIASFYYDLTAATSEAQLGAILKLVPVSQLLMGLDLPLCPNRPLLQPSPTLDFTQHSAKRTCEASRMRRPSAYTRNSLSGSRRAHEGAPGSHHMIDFIRYSSYLGSDRRLRDLGSTALIPLAIIVFTTSKYGAPFMYQGLTNWWAPLLLGWTALSAITEALAPWSRRFCLARIAAVAQVTFILVGWGLAQFPHLVTPDVTLQNAAAPESTLKLFLLALGAGAVVLLPSLLYLFQIFKGQEQR